MARASSRRRTDGGAFDELRHNLAHRHGQLSARDEVGEQGGEGSRKADRTHAVTGGLRRKMPGKRIVGGSGEPGTGQNIQNTTNSTGEWGQTNG